MEEDTRLIAISFKRTLPQRVPGPGGRLYQSVEIRGDSRNRELAFTVECGPLSPERMEFCNRLKRHGFTVVEAPDDWRYGYHGAGGWKEVVIQRAFERMERLQPIEGTNDMQEYDSELALSVLRVAGDRFPKRVRMDELKHALDPEPSNDQLMTAIDALLIDELIEGPHKRAGIYGELRFIDLVQITGKGRKHLAALVKPDSELTPPIAHMHISGSTFHNSPIGVGQQFTQVVNSSSVSWVEAFSGIRSEISKLIDDATKRAEIIARLDELEAANDKPSRFEKYTKLVATIGDHITVLGFLLPPLLEWVVK
jgi:hypothetical protein